MTLIMNRIQHRFVPILLALVAALTPLARAQDGDPMAILEASRQALSEIPGLTAQFKMEGEGGSMFAETLPSMSGMLFYGEHDEYGPVIRVIGEARDAQNKPTTPVDMLLAGDRFVWLDRANRIIHETPPRKNLRGNPTALTLVLIDSILDDDPFGRDVVDAQSIELGAREQIGGVLCDQIVIKRKARERGMAQSTSDSYTDAVWYIGVEDKLPRRVEQITDADFLKITLAFTATELNITDPPDEQLEVDRPDGFTFRSRLPGQRDDTAEPAAPASGTGAGDAADQLSGDSDAPAPSPEPGNPAAPRFSFTPVGGDEVSSSRQAGRLTVLYFWGSWCMPCAESTPLVSQLASDFSGRGVDVFGVAIRESDPQRVAASFSDADYSHQLVINADELVRSFKVRVFPTIAVIDQGGAIVFQRGISRETGAAELVRAAREAVEQASSDE